jgi:hypothetical protein
MLQIIIATTVLSMSKIGYIFEKTVISQLFPTLGALIRVSKSSFRA